MLKIALLVALVGLSTARTPCCAPDQWEAISEIITGAVNDGKASEVEVSSMISYDFLNMMLSATIEFTEESMMVRNRTIFNYNTNIMYNFDMNTLACTVMSFDKPFEKACSPPDSKEAGDFYYGAGSNMLKASAFMSMEEELKTIYVVTSMDCFPISEIVYGKKDGTSFVTTSEFVDITTGIKDPSVFTPPSTCRTPKNPKQASLKRGALGLPMV